jgi:hypothetical protein
MIAPDVNVLLYAHREDSERHGEYHEWLLDALNGSERVALFERCWRPSSGLPRIPASTGRRALASWSRSSSTPV